MPGVVRQGMEEGNGTMVEIQPRASRTKPGPSSEELSFFIGLLLNYPDLPRTHGLAAGQHRLPQFIIEFHTKVVLLGLG